MKIVEYGTLGFRIRELRKRKGLTLSQLAKLLQKPPPTVSAWELNKAVPNGGNLITLSRTLGTDVETLTGAEPTLERPVGDVQPGYDDPFLTACRTILESGPDDLVSGFLANIWGFLAQVDGQESEAMRLRDLVNGYRRRRKKTLQRAG